MMNFQLKNETEKKEQQQTGYTLDINKKNIINVHRLHFFFL